MKHILSILLLLIVFINCNGQKKDTTLNNYQKFIKYNNLLKNATDKLNTTRNPKYVNLIIKYQDSLTKYHDLITK